VSTNDENFDRHRWRYQMRRDAARVGTNPKEKQMVTSNRNAPPPIAGAGGAGTNPQMVARAYAAIGRLVNEGGLPPLAVAKLVAANTRLLAVTLAVEPPADPKTETDLAERTAPATDADESAWSDEKVPNEIAVDPAAAVARMNANVAEQGEDVPNDKRTLVPSPFAQRSIKQWAQGAGARRAGLPRPQRRG
jgi:hypothetical protein